MASSYYYFLKSRFLHRQKNKKNDNSEEKYEELIPVQEEKVESNKSENVSDTDLQLTRQL